MLIVAGRSYGSTVVQQRGGGVSVSSILPACLLPTTEAAAHPKTKEAKEKQTKKRERSS
jgi:hypothetical protein